MQRKSYEIASVLPVTESFSPIAAGGVGLFVKEASDGSAYQNYITVYGRSGGTDRRFSNVRFQGIKPSMEMLRGSQSGYAAALVSHFKRRPTGLIEVHNNVSLFKTLRKNFPNMPVTLFLHDDPLDMAGARSAKERWDILSSADAIYCCSDFTRRRFLTGLEAGRTDHVHVVYSGVNAQTRGKKEAFILYAGHLTPEKGALELAHAAARILPHFPDWKIVFVGSARPTPANKPSSYARDVASAVEPLGKQAVFLGHLTHHKVMQLFARAAIAVVPSQRAEPFGRTAAEAMASGAALITSGHGGLAEIAGDAGIFVSPVTPDGIALSLQGLMEDPNTLRAIQQQCFDRGALFSLDAARQHIDALRHHLLSQAYGA